MAVSCRDSDRFWGKEKPLRVCLNISKKFDGTMETGTRTTTTNSKSTGSFAVVVEGAVGVVTILVLDRQYWPSAGRPLMHPHVSPTMASQACWLMQLLYDQAKLSSHVHWYPVAFSKHTVVVSVFVISVELSICKGNVSVARISRMFSRSEILITTWTS